MPFVVLLLLLLFLSSGVSAQSTASRRWKSGNASARYLRGQVLMRMGRKKEGREELASATKMLNPQRAARHKELEGETVPSPELARAPE
jgi:hypothetical protein